MVTAVCPRQQQVGHIHGGDDHHEDHQDEHDRSTRRIRSKLILFRPGKTLRQNSDRNIGIRVGILTRETLRHDIDGRLCHVDRDLWPEPRQRVKATGLPVLEVARARPVQREVQLGL